MSQTAHICTKCAKKGHIWCILIQFPTKHKYLAVISQHQLLLKCFGKYSWGCKKTCRLGEKTQAFQLQNSMNRQYPTKLDTIIKVLKKSLLQIPWQIWYITVLFLSTRFIHSSKVCTYPKSSWHGREESGVILISF